MDKTSFNKKFGKFVAKQRKNRGWSQAELASRMGNNYQNISRIERGDQNPTLFWVYRLSIIFDMDYDLFSTELNVHLKNKS